ncbi:MAG: 5-oxoprolinase, partial [Candidatus Dadabacteria bacterium]
FPAPVLVTTTGFGDILLIDDQRRAELFSWQGPAARARFEHAIELDVRVSRNGDWQPPCGLPEAFESDRPVAISFVGAWRAPEAEQAVADELRARGVRSITCGTDLSGQIGFADRTRTAAVNAGLQPVVDDFIGRIRSELGDIPVEIMASSGGLRRPETFMARDSILSGPAAGAAAAAALRASLGGPRLLTLDMGGTSTDVTRIDDHPRRCDAVTVGGLRVSGTAVAIETVAAGGGSVCWFDGVRLRVGPQSAGAEPGPAAYGRGGPLTLTDVNLLRGRLDADAFDLPLDLQAAREMAMALSRESGVALDEMLDGLIAIADDVMAEAIRTVTVREGVNPADYVLCAFGGAGGVHAARLADELGIGEVIVPPYAGVLSAWGLLQAQPQLERVVTLLAAVDDLDTLQSVQSREAERLVQRLESIASAQSIRIETTWFVRARGQSVAVAVEGDPGQDLECRFREAYTALYGHRPPDVPVEVERMRIVATRRGDVVPLSQSRSRSERRGPCTISEAGASIWIPDGWVARPLGETGWRLARERQVVRARRFSDAVEVERFATRVGAIADQMGEQLRRTAMSVNVRERGDYSCAVLDVEGNLIANAPHIPVHLGALGACVRALSRQADWRPGMSVLTNHPRWGGSHLPDLTVVTPVFGDSGLLGFVASRAHHAEIGGRTPGSLPPDAACLDEEGVPIAPLVIEDDGVFREAALRQVLGSHSWPSRRIDENVADVRAQLAANHRGRTLMMALGTEMGAADMARFAKMLFELSAMRVREALARVVDRPRRGETPVEPEGQIVVSLEPLPSGRVRIDFSGTSAVSRNNLNAPLAVTRSAVMFALRTLSCSVLPLNEGLLAPVDLVVPECCLNPDFSGESAPAVVGGNTELSQLVVAALLDALGVAAGSQGTMNNLVFGNARFSFYETLGGGCGAIAHRAGDAAVHSHMTNTALTDVEIFEHRYPARIDALSVRRGSGGSGRHCGGDGLRRIIRFEEPVQLSLLSQYRHAGPPGREGGAAGAPGRQWLEFADGQTRELRGVDAASVEADTRLVIETPGGGGWGACDLP